MCVFHGFNYIAFLIFLVECPVNYGRDTDYKKIHVNQLAEQKQPNNPNIFKVFQEIIDNKEENPLANPKYKEILDRADGIGNWNKLKTRISSKPPRRFHRSGGGNKLSAALPVLRKFGGSSETSSTSTSAESKKESNKSEEMSAEIKRQIGIALKVGTLFTDEDDGKASKGKKKPTWFRRIPEIDLNDSTLKQVLRLGSSCNKGASKACVSACKSVLKGVCHEYKCSSGLKSKFKSECSRNCRTRFGVN